MRADLLPTTLTGSFRRVISEAAEIIHAITKLEQFGPTAIDPVMLISYDNVHTLLSEFNDIKHAMMAVEDYYRRRGIEVPMPDIPVPVIDADDDC